MNKKIFDFPVAILTSLKVVKSNIGILQICKSDMMKILYDQNRTFIELACNMELLQSDMQ